MLAKYADVEFIHITTTYQILDRNKNFQFHII